MTYSTRLCVALTDPTSEGMASILDQRSEEFDIAEIRLDYMVQPDIARILSHRRGPLIFTNRSKRDRGLWQGDEDSRLALLKEAADLGADYIDIEMENLSQFKRAGKSQWIVSYHNFKETPANLLEIAKEIEEMDSDVVKLAAFANSHEDNLRMLEVLRCAKKPTIALTMGPHGHILRMLGPKYGAFLVFASLGEGKESAPGQVPATILTSFFRFREITPDTRLYAVFNEPQGIQLCRDLNASFDLASLDRLAFPVYEQNLCHAFAAYRGLPLDGLYFNDSHTADQAKLRGLLPKTACEAPNAYCLRSSPNVGIKLAEAQTDDEGMQFLATRLFYFWTSHSS